MDKLSKPQHNEEEMTLLNFIQTDSIKQFEELLETIKFGDSQENKQLPIKSKQNLTKVSLEAEKILPHRVDEFRLITEIVKFERVNFLKMITDKNLFPITQKDEYTGDNLLHYAVLSKKPNFIVKVKHMFENEINNRNEQGNTPFHYACLLGNLDLVQALVSGKSQVKGKKSSQQNFSVVKSQVEMCAVNKADLMPIHLAIARSHFFIVNFLLSYEQILTTLLQSRFELYRCFKLAISSKSLQILQLLFEVFQEQVEKLPDKERGQRSFWERSFKKQKTQNQNLLNLTGDNSNTFEDSLSSDSESEDSIMDDNKPRKKKNEGEFSLLHYASSCRDSDIFLFVRSKCTDLMNFLFDVDSNSMNETPLHWAVNMNDLQIAKFLIEDMRQFWIERKEQRRGSNPIKSKSLQEDYQSDQESSLSSNPYHEMLDLKNVCNHTPFFVAVIKDQLEMAMMLLEDRMSSVDFQDVQDDSPLHWAVILNNAKVVQFLLDQGVKKDGKNKGHNTPFMIACINSRFEILKLLLTATQWQFTDGLTLAQQQQQIYDPKAPKLVSPRTKEFEQIRVMVNIPNSQRMTPLHAACLSGDVQIVDILIKNGADIYIKDYKQFIPLHYAVVKDHIQVLRYLYTNKENKINLFDERLYCNQHKLMALAIQNGAYNTIKQLVEWGSNCQEKDQMDYTYLHMAAVSGHVNIFLFFLSKQVPIHAKTKNNKTAIELAKQYDHHHLIKYLRDKFEAASVFTATQNAQPIDAKH